jgi:hypothetical protein
LCREGCRQGRSEKEQKSESRWAQAISPKIVFSAVWQKEWRAVGSAAEGKGTITGLR